MFGVWPICNHGEIRWLTDDEKEYPEDMGVLEDYKDVKPSLYIRKRLVTK